MDVCIVSSDSVRSLVERSRAGDREAFEVLIERHRSQLRAAILSSVEPRFRDVVGVEDLAQEANSSALSSLQRFEWRGEGSFAAWLRQVARHVVRSELRKSKRHSTLEITREPEGADPSPSRLARREERFERLEAAFAQLT